MSTFHYDHVASDFDRRYEGTDVHPIAQALRKVLRGQEAQRVLEVGCGTGQWLARLKGDGRQLVGLDPSLGMLRRAKERAMGAELVQGWGEALPFASASWDGVYLVQVMHHLRDWYGFLVQARRVLAPGGVLALVGQDWWAEGTTWYVYDVFPGVREVDAARFPHWELVEEAMQTLGFEQVSRRVVQVVDICWRGEEVFQDPYLAKQATSQLAMLTDAAYQEGLQRLRERIRQQPDACFRTRLSMVMVVGIRGG